MITKANPGARRTGADSQVTGAEARGFEPRKGANPNRISSSDRGRSDPFKLDQRLCPVLPGRYRTAVNCNPNCNPNAAGLASVLCVAAVLSGRR